MAKSKGKAERHVALMRGLNLGGRRVPMPRLAALFEKAGCGNVVTFIASGNVVFDAHAALAARIPELVRKAVAKEFGFDMPVVTRTASEMGRIVRANPFVIARVDVKTLHVSFLAEKPTAARIAALDARRSAPDEFTVIGREIYLRLSNGAGKTKLSNAWFDAKLGTISTMRNWATTLTLLEMANDRG